MSSTASDTFTMCGNCACESESVHFCYSCAKHVCDNCMVEEEGSCLCCIEAFPTGAPFHASALWHTMEQFFTPPQEPPNLSEWEEHADVQAQLQPPMHDANVDFESSEPLIMLSLSDSLHFEEEVWCMQESEEQHMMMLDYCEDSTYMYYQEEAYVKEFAGHDRSGSKSTSMSASESTCYDEDTDGSCWSDESATMMIRNIPRRLTQNDLVKAIDSIGFNDSYNFVYLPGQGRGHAKMKNIGYGFVNFKTTQDAECFAYTFEGFQFPGSNSAKRCVVKPAAFHDFDLATAYRPPPLY